MKKSLLTSILISYLVLLPLSAQNKDFIKGVDISFLNQIEDNNGIYYENGVPGDALNIFKNNGINYIRLRIWHTPEDGYTNLDKTLLIAERIKALGLKLLIDFHYSDTWADPGWQSKPADWENLSFQLLKDSIYYYTFNVITALKNQNTLPDMVQIGNEIICGMLWNDGRICESYNTFQQWDQFTQLVKEGIRGVKESLSPGDSVKIMIHIDRGGDNAGSQWFFNNLIALGIDFDIIGLSYYPWWHGNLKNLKYNLNDLALRYNKEIIVVETAYPCTLDWFDNTHNLVGDTSQLHSGYPATVDGQKSFLNDLIELILKINNDKGAGLFYWAPEYISVPALESSWENLTLFDFNGELLSSIEAFNFDPADIQYPPQIDYSFHLYQNYPNPFNPVTRIKFSIPVAGNVTIKVYDILGNEIKTILNEYKAVGTYETEFAADSLPNSVYCYRMISGDYSVTKKMILLK